MKEKVGEVFSIARDNAPVRGCTISREVHGGTSSITYFSLAGGTDISAEIHPYHKLILVMSGSIAVYGEGAERRLGSGDGLLTEADKAVGIRASEDAVYTEISVQKEDRMNTVIKAGEVFRLAYLVPY